MSVSTRVTFIVGLALLVGCRPSAKQVLSQRPASTPAQREEFLRLVEQLPSKGEFYTPEAVQKMKPYTPVLLSLTVDDLKDKYLYPLLALSGDLVNDKEQQAYGKRYFSDIAHPTIRLAWAVLLFQRDAATPEIVRFLQEALAEPARQRIMAEMLGPEFDLFRQRVLAAR